MQNRDRERSASGVADPSSLLPSLPQSVRDRRGRVIPARFRKWLEETKSLPQTQIASSPFVPLKLVETAELKLEKEAPINSQVEILSPSGFSLKLDKNADIDFVSKLLRSLENK